MSRIGYDLGTIGVLWRRDLRIFLRQPSRIFGAMLTVFLLWLAIGAGFTPSFAAPDGKIDYMEYFFPGVILMLLLQVSIGATMSVIEDRNQGFLRGVLVAPGSRASVAVGKVLGAATVALLHAALFAAAAPLAGFSYGRIGWGSLALFSTLAAVALTAMGFVIAWVLDSIQGYHVVMNVVLFPAWILSGAMFPATGLHPALETLVAWNPMTYFMSGLRRAFYDGSPIVGSGSGEWDATIASATALAWIVAACWVCARRAGTDRG